jgi:hypothetical protein
MALVDEILRRPELAEAPPVLVDVGASGAPHAKWKPIARYSVCVAFEGGEANVPSSTRGFRQLHVVPSVVAERPAQREPFYLTRFPYCSSRLRPNHRALNRYAFGPLFEVERVAEVDAVGLRETLAQLGLERVDWFKSDSQGTDLRLFASLGDELVSHVLLAEFEPGIIDAYEDEDKLTDVMRYLDERNFWPSHLEVKGSQRIDSSLLERTLPPRLRRHLGVAVKSAPCWAEIEYLNDFEQESVLGKREYLLGCVLAWLRGHYGFVLELAGRGRTRFGDEIFGRVERAAALQMRLGFARLPLAAARSLSGRLH